MNRSTPGPHGFWATALLTTLNSVLYTLTFGRFLWLEGRRSGPRRWHNWSHGWVHEVEPFLLPTTEQEIIAAVRGQRRMRAVGAGHSFNAGVVSEATLSLDEYSGIVSVDAGRKQVRVRAGTRMRDVNPMLWEHGLAIIALPSHDAQSIAGILSTDVHGTGREFAFVSQSVAALRVVDGLGEAHDVTPGDDLFRAALGGIGAVGLITEVTIQCVDAFRIRQRSERWTREKAQAELDDLMTEHDHVSFYVFPFADYVQVHTWDRTDDPRSRFDVLREYVNITGQALASVWVGDLFARTRLLPRFANAALRLQQNTDLVMRSYDGFTRTIYPLHQELEFAVPSDQVWEVNDHLAVMYEQMYRSKRLPFTLFELRFTPADHRLSLISPGASGPPQVYVNLVCNQSGAYEDFYAEAETYIREIGGRPHLGKWCESWTSADLARMHGADFTRFRELRQRHDPNGRFRNDFTDRLFGPPSG